MHVGSGNDDSGVAAAPDTRPKPFVFVLMPFREEFDDIYQLGIKDTCRDLGLHCERVDEQIYKGVIMDRVYAQIARADVIVSEMTGRNPNVFYETGYAHALGKTVILLTQKSEDIPFDLIQYPHVVYEGRIRQLKAELEKRLRWCVEHPKDSLSRVEFPMTVYIGKEKLDEAPVIPYRIRAEANVQYIEFEIVLHNGSGRPVHPEAVQLAIVSPADIPGSSETVRTVSLPDGRYLHTLRPLPLMFPDTWHSFNVGLSKSRDQSFVGGDRCELLLRGYTELGARDFPFALEFQAVSRTWKLD